MENFLADDVLGFVLKFRICNTKDLCEHGPLYQRILQKTRHYYEDVLYLGNTGPLIPIPSYNTFLSIFFKLLCLSCLRKNICLTFPSKNSRCHKYNNDFIQKKFGLIMPGSPIKKYSCRSVFLYGLKCYKTYDAFLARIEKIDQCRVRDLKNRRKFRVLEKRKYAAEYCGMSTAYIAFDLFNRVSLYYPSTYPWQANITPREWSRRLAVNARLLESFKYCKTDVEREELQSMIDANLLGKN